MNNDKILAIVGLVCSLAGLTLAIIAIATGGK